MVYSNFDDCIRSYYSYFVNGKYQADVIYLLSIAHFRRLKWLKKCRSQPPVTIGSLLLGIREKSSDFFVY